MSIAYRIIGAAFTIKVIGSIFAFLFTLVATRFLGAEQAGMFFLSISIITILSVFGRFGLDGTLLRFTSAFIAKKQGGKAKFSVLIGTAIATIVSSLILVLTYYFVDWLAIDILGNREMSKYLNMLLILVLPLSILNLISESLRGYGKQLSAIVFQGLTIPTTALITFYPLYLLLGSRGIILAHILSVVLASIMATATWYSLHEVRNVKLKKIKLGSLLSSSWPLYPASIVGGAVMPWSAVLFLGVWESSASIAIFVVATRIANLFGMILNVVNGYAAPQFAKLHAQSNMESLQEFSKYITRNIIIFTIPAFGGTIYFAGEIIAIFGQEFHHGKTVLRVLIVGQMVNLYAGPVGRLLVSCGYEKDVRIISLTSATILLVLLVLIIPTMGILGAAIATTISLAAMNALNFIRVKKRLGFWAL